MPSRQPAKKKKERSVFGNIALFTATLLIICVALIAIAGVGQGSNRGDPAGCAGNLH